jgi:hypothetical protein
MSKPKTANLKIEGFAPTISLRYNFTYNFLVGAATLAKYAKAIEEKGKASTELEQLQYKSFVAGSIMQSVAALESDAWTVVNHGPWHHLRSDGLDKPSLKILSVVSSMLDKESILKKYDTVLQITASRKLKLGDQPMQDVKLLVNLRNELIHFKSLGTDELSRRDLFKQLEKKDSTRPSYYPDGFMNFFPHICLNSSRAKWAVNTVIDFLDHFYRQLEIESSLKNFDRNQITIS